MTYEVTIGIPVYNVKPYIRQMMESVLAQTFQSIEILVCDDCGTDGSMDIVEEYRQTHPRGKDIHIVRQPHNMGIGAARNLMMDEAQGRYFYSLDADDDIMPDTIALLHAAAQEHQAEIVYGSYERVYQSEGVTTRKEPCAYPPMVFTEPDSYADYVYYVGIQGMNWNYLIDISIIRRNGLKATPVGHGYGEDFTYTIDLPTYVTRAVLLPDITYHYYIRGTDKHKQKKVLRRKDMTLALKALDEKKRRNELKGKRYYAKRMAILMMLDCSFACEMVARRKEFDEPFTDSEVRAAMWHPMTLWEILTSKSERLHNLLYYIYGTVPAWLCVWLLKPMIKRYGRG